MRWVFALDLWYKNEHLVARVNKKNKSRVENELFTSDNHKMLKSGFQLSVESN